MIQDRNKVRETEILQGRSTSNFNLLIRQKFIENIEWDHCYDFMEYYPIVELPYLIHRQTSKYKSCAEEERISMRCKVKLLRETG